MKWWVQCFDKNWARCMNHECRALFWLFAVKHRRKCPECRMNNSHQLFVVNETEENDELQTGMHREQ